MNASEMETISIIANKVKNIFSKEGSGHDWWHIYRVWKTSIKIAEKENANTFIVQLAALLHDIADWKFYNGDQNIGPQKAAEILKEHNINVKLIKQIQEIIKNLSFKGAKTSIIEMKSIEGKVVQDADRLDAIGAIGIARTFAYGGYKNRIIYNPKIKPILHKNADSYIKNNSPTINHFYEKLLLLKNLMNTKTGKEIAEKRHDFMNNYLNQFYKEWNQEI